MKTIKIKRLALENFKCHRSLTLDFMGGNASIYGDNATGKTSIYDALTWLLFGKDSRGNGEKNIEIKPLDISGAVKDHQAITSVEAVLLVNDTELSLRRTLQEVWSTKRGSTEATYDGNTSEYFVDGVPCKKYAFTEKVDELVSEDIFRMLTSVSYFPNEMLWQERREVLFKVAGTMSDEQILATREDFAPLVESVGKLSIEDYKKKLLSEKRGFVGVRDELPARINECEKTIEDIEGLDFAGAKAEVEALNAKKDSLSAQIVAIEHDNAADQKRMEIREVQLELTALENENRAYRTSQNSGLLNVQNLKIDLTALKNRLDKKQHELMNEKAYITSLEEKVTMYRERWMSVNGESFSGGTCPTCGQNLPTAQLQTAREQFEANKQKRLDDILQAANSYKESKAQAENRLDKQQEEIHQIEAEIQQKNQDIATAEAHVVTIVDMEGYAERKEAIQARIDALNAELYEMMQASADVVGKLRMEITECTAQINNHMDVISKENLLEYSKKRVDELREDAKNAAECLGAIENMLFLMDEYSRYKTTFVEDSINGLFRIARFRLFREQANGGIEDRCDCVHNGVPYISVNNGAKINLGIDIINTLSKAYGVSVPLFVDNAESVTNIEKTDSQIIRLVVSEKEKELSVNYEG